MALNTSKTALVSVPSDLDRRIEGKVDSALEAGLIRRRTMMTLLPTAFQPRVESAMREKVDVTYAILFELSEEECNRKREEIRLNDPELFQAMLDALDDDNDRLKAEASSRDDEWRNLEKTYLQAEEVLREAGSEALEESGGRIVTHPLYQSLDVIDVEATEPDHKKNLQVA